MPTTDLYTADFPHGAPAGYDRGCRTAAMLAAHGIGYKRAAALAGVGTTAARTILWGRQEPGPRYGELQKRVKRETAEKLLAVQPDLDALAAGVTVPATATIRRLRALIAAGYTMTHLAHELGLGDPNGVSLLLARYDRTAPRHRSTITVTARRAREVRDLYEHIAFTPPAENTPQQRRSAAASRARGQQHDWPLPMDWAAIDDDFDRKHPVRRSRNAS